MTEPKSSRDELTGKTEKNAIWNLAVSLNQELIRAKNDLEKALLDKHPFQHSDKV